MKLKSLLTTLAAAVGITTAATAATPVAVWDGGAGDFEESKLAKEGYTLSLNENAASDGVVTMTAGKKGLKIAWTGSTNPFGTDQNTTFVQVLVRYSDLTAPTADNTGRVLVSLSNSVGGNGDYLGTCVIKDGVTRGIWGGNSGEKRIYANSASGTMASPVQSGKANFVYSYTRGTPTGVNGYVDGSQAYGNSGLKAGYTVQDIYIGGSANASDGNFAVCEGMKIYGIAVFTSAMTADEMAAYRFPSELVTTPTMSLGFDNGKAASTVLGGTAPSSFDDWGTATYTQVRDSESNYAMTLTSSIRPNAAVPSGMNANTSWSVHGVMKLAEVENGVLFGISPAVWQNCKYIGVEYVGADQVRVVYGTATGAANKNVLIDSVTVPASKTAYHSYLLTFNAGASGTEESPYYTLYVDGAKVGDSGTADKVTGYATRWCLGNYFGGASSTGAAIFDGAMIDDFAIWADTCLNASQAADLASKFDVWPKSFTYTAEVSTDMSWSELVWSPEKPSTGFTVNDKFVINNTAAATLTFDEEVTADTISVTSETDNALTLCFDEAKAINSAWDFTAAEGGVIVKADKTGEDLAKCAVAGAPYSYWLIKGTVTGTVAMDSSITLPKGYTASAVENVGSYGARVVITAPAKATFGALSVNFYRVNALGSGVSGFYPVDRSLWKNLTISGGASATYDEATVTLSANASSYAKGGVGDPIYQDYIDDSQSGGVTKGFTLTNITYDKYRIIVYFNSDDNTATKPFYPMVVNGVSYAGVYKDGTASATVKGATATWGQNGLRGTPAEGNNALITDVMTDETVTLEFLNASGRGTGRATPAAFQIVKVGELYADVPYTATVDASTDWNAITWSPEKPEGGFPDNAVLTITATDNPTITFTAAEALNIPLTINGAVTIAAADSFYEDGCWEKTIATFSSFTADGATFADLKSGFAGAYTKTETGFKLRGQNKEVISINIAGGAEGDTGADSPEENLVSGSDYYGIAPTLGDSWNNINRQWQNGGNQTITIKSPNAYTGTETIQRPTMSLSATGKNTWQCGSIDNPFLRGYLDDGNGVTVTVHGVPYTKYDVIVYVTSDSSLALAPVTVNGTTYTYVNGELTEGDTAWGVGMYATPEVGKNAIRINDCTGELLTVSAASRASGTSNPRGTFCAVQVINKGDVVVTTDYVGEMTGNVVWTDGAADANLTSLGDPWVSGDYSTITITNKAENATFSFAQATEGLSIKFVSEEGCALTMDAKNIVQNGKLKSYDFTEAAGGVTIQLPTDEAFDPTTLPTMTGNWKCTGILVFDGTFPTSAQRTFFKSDAWQGTVWLKNVSIGGTSTPLCDFCNSNSIIRVTGVSGWLRNDPAAQGVATLELVDEAGTNALEIVDSSQTRIYAFDKIIGSGTFKFATKAVTGCAMVLNDVSEFTGKLLSTAVGTNTTARPIFIGETGTSSTKSLISVASDMTINAPCGWEAGSVAFGTNLTVKGASLGTVIVSNVTNEVPVLGTKVTLDGVDGIYCLAYDTEAKNVKVATPVAFTVADCDNATFTVAGAFENGGSYYAADGAPITVTYTASEGYTFISTGTGTLVVNGTASAGSAFSAGEKPVAPGVPFIFTIAEGEEGVWTLDGTVVTKAVVDADTSREIWKQGNGSMTNVVINRTYVVKEGTMVAGNAKNLTGTVTVEAGATFDFNGKVDGYTTINLNGGSLVNNGGAMGSGSRQIEGIALTKDSTIGGTSIFGMSSNSHHANVIDLGGCALTKEDANTFFLCNTTVTNGNVVVNGGTLEVADVAAFVEAGLTINAGTTLKVDSNKTLTIGAITASEATINNTGTISPFVLTGTATLTGSGNWGTITNAAEAAATVGINHAITFAGAGTINATLTADEFNAGQATLFTPAEDATTVIGTVMYGGKDITDKCTISGNQITAIDREAKIGSTYYLTLAEALNAAQGKETVTLLKTVTVSSLTVPEDVTLDLNNFHVQTTAVVNNGTILVYDIATATALKDLDGTLRAGADLDSKPAMFYPQGTTVAHSTEVVESAEHTNNVPTLEVTVPETRTVIWAQGVGPYNKMYVYGDAVFAGNINGGWDTNKLMTVFGIGGALKLNSDVNIGKFASATAYGTLDLNGKAFIINDTDAILTTITNLVVGTDVTTDKAGYEVRVTESEGYYCYTIAEKPQGTVLLISGTTTNRYETIAAAVEAATAGDTVTLLKDMTLDATLTVNKAITLDLGNKTVTLADAQFGIVIDADATVQNGSIASALAANRTSSFAVYVNPGKSPTLKNLAIDASYYEYGLACDSAHTSKNLATAYETAPSSTVTCQNVDVTGNGALIYAQWCNVTLDANCSAITNGLAFFANEAHRAAVYSALNARVTIAGGTYTHEKALLSGNLGAMITVNGGTFNGQVYSWMESAAHDDLEQYDDYVAKFILNAGTYTGAIAFKEDTDAARELDYFEKDNDVALTAPEGYEWNAEGVLVKKSDEPSIPEEQGTVDVDAQGNVTVHPLNDTVTEIELSNVSADATVTVPLSVERVKGVEDYQLEVTYTPTEAGSKTYYITEAFDFYGDATSGVTYELNPDGSVEIGEETIPVTPAATTDAETPIADGAVATKTIPGLTYQLVRGDEPDQVTTALTTEGAKVTATTTSTTLTDVNKPETKAFYKIQVTK